EVEGDEERALHEATLRQGGRLGDLLRVGSGVKNGGNERARHELHLAFGIPDALKEEPREGAEERVSWRGGSRARGTHHPALYLLQELGAYRVHLDFARYAELHGARDLSAVAREPATDLGAAPEHAFYRRGPADLVHSRARELHAIRLFPDVPRHLAGVGRGGQRIAAARAVDRRREHDRGRQAAPELLLNLLVDHVSKGEVEVEELSVCVPRKERFACGIARASFLRLGARRRQRNAPGHRDPEDGRPEYAAKRALSPHRPVPRPARA